MTDYIYETWNHCIEIKKSFFTNFPDNFLGYLNKCHRFFLNQNVNPSLLNHSILKSIEYIEKDGILGLVDTINKIKKLYNGNTKQKWRLTISCMKVGRKRRTSVFYVRYVVHVLKRFVAVVTMACLSSSRLCARVQDKLLCQFGHKVRRQTVFVKLKPPGPSPLRIFGKTCQVSHYNLT